MSDEKKIAAVNAEYLPAATRQRVVVLRKSLEKSDMREEKRFQPATLVRLVKDDDEQEDAMILNLLAVRNDCDSDRRTIMIDMEWLEAMDQLFLAVHPRPNLPDNVKCETVDPSKRHEYEGLPWSFDPRTDLCAEIWGAARLGALIALKFLFEYMTLCPRYINRLHVRRVEVHAALDILFPRLFEALKALSKLVGCFEHFQEYIDLSFHKFLDKDVILRLGSIANLTTAVLTSVHFKKCAAQSLAPWLAVGAIPVTQPYFPVCRSTPPYNIALQYRWGPTELASSGPDANMYSKRLNQTKLPCDYKCDPDSHANECASRFDDVFDVWHNNPVLNKLQEMERKRQYVQHLLFRPSWLEILDWINPDFSNWIMPGLFPDMPQVRKTSAGAARKFANAMKQRNLHPREIMSCSWKRIVGPSALLDSNDELCKITDDMLNEHRAYIAKTVHIVMEEGWHPRNLVWPFPQLEAAENQFFVRGDTRDSHMYALEQRMRAVREHLTEVGRNGVAAQVINYVSVDLLALIIADYLLCSP